jgi:hypothetical protein
VVCGRSFPQYSFESLFTKALYLLGPLSHVPLSQGIFFGLWKTFSLGSDPLFRGSAGNRTQYLLFSSFPVAAPAGFQVPYVMQARRREPAATAVVMNIAAVTGKVSVFVGFLF